MDAGAPTAYPQYLQLLSVGVLWISLHCAGMCGPLVLGLDLAGTLGAHAPPGAGGARRGRATLAAVLNLLAYQAGRSLTYGVMGALAGWGGGVLQQAFQRVTAVSGLLLAAALLLAGLLGLLRIRAPLPALQGGGPGRALGAVARRLRSPGGWPRRLALGVVLGLLPCMIPLWVLGLAASTASALHGALLMVLLVWLTSGVIFGVGLAPGLMPPSARALGRRLFPLALLLSGGWMALIAAAANGWIAHQGLGFRLLGRGYTVMFW